MRIAKSKTPWDGVMVPNKQVVTASSQLHDDFIGQSRGCYGLVGGAIKASLHPCISLECGGDRPPAGFALAG
jgi:hypothetical protein